MDQKLTHYTINKAEKEMKKKFALKSGCLNIAVKKVSSEIASRGNKISEKWPQNWHEIGPNEVTQLLGKAPKLDQN